MFSIFVPGKAQPPELAYFKWAKGLHETIYAFDTRQQAFDATDVLRRAKLPYDLQTSERNRWPWLARAKETA
jgi:hypothetical protein